jgi:hypothetical protein
LVQSSALPLVDLGLRQDRRLDQDQDQVLLLAVHQLLQLCWT